ncbi:hypothetical protein [Methylobacter tundripaludum]|uniref:hypothetical protein n=1 Tax=Methylobacter tundripaludum TaxID=173365 RepID=UPI00068CBE78|nr:hypothetical protein [Methylobacter tundripaludum]
MEFPDVDPALLKTLPPIARLVIKALGFTRAQEWLRDYGGVNVHIPLKKSRALGLQEDELERLRYVLQPHLSTNKKIASSNNRITLPKVDKMLIMHRNAAIISNASKESIALQARIYNLSSRQITNIRGKDNGGQLDLFGE